jgi:hypothetical protein
MWLPVGALRLQRRLDAGHLSTIGTTFSKPETWLRTMTQSNSLTIRPLSDNNFKVLIDIPKWNHTCYKIG